MHQRKVGECILKYLLQHCQKVWGLCPTLVRVIIHTYIVGTWHLCIDRQPHTGSHWGQWCGDSALHDASIYSSFFSTLHLPTEDGQAELMFLVGCMLRWSQFPFYSSFVKTPLICFVCCPRNLLFIWQIEYCLLFLLAVNMHHTNNNNHKNVRLLCCRHGIVTVRVHLIHLMNADLAWGGCQIFDKAANLGCESTGWLLPSTPTVAIYYCCSVQYTYSV